MKGSWGELVCRSVCRWSRRSSAAGRVDGRSPLRCRNFARPRRSRPATPQQALAPTGTAGCAPRDHRPPIAESVLCPMRLVTVLRMKRLSACAISLTILFGVAACSSSDDAADKSTTTTPASDQTPTTTDGTTTTELVGGADSAEEAVVNYIEAAALDQWGKVYDSLHPDQRALFTKETFLTCSEQIPFQVEGVNVVDTYDEPSPLPGVSESAPSTAVTVTVTLSSGNEQTLTAHAYEVGGRWWSSVDEEKVADCTN